MDPWFLVGEDLHSYDGNDVIYKFCNKVRKHFHNQSDVITNTLLEHISV